MAKRCLVFGAGGYVGAAVCRALRACGHVVAGTYHQSHQAVAALAEQLPLQLVTACDVRRQQQIKEAVTAAADSMQGLDALLYCVGDPGEARHYQRDGSGSYMAGLQAGEVEQVWAVNAAGALHACRYGFEAMTASRTTVAGQGGEMVVIGSMDGIKAMPSPAHFAMSKAALKGMVSSLSKEMGPHGIRINLVCPGILEQGGSSFICEAMKQDYLKHCGLARFGKAGEVASVAAWLVDKNSYLTGEYLLLDGGL